MAVDEGGDPATSDLCGDLVDRHYRLESALPQRILGWLFHQCASDWILRLDDDEVPSAALLDALPELVEEKRVTNMPFPRRWLYPSADRYITDHPWTPDYQIRLVRNLPGIWSFPGLPHEDLAVLGERRFVDLPLYHVDLLVNTYADRERKRARYETQQPGHENQGFPVNMMYAPEDIGPATAAVPDEDSALIGRLVTGSTAAGTPATPPVHVPAATAERFFVGRQFKDSGYRARLRFVRPPSRLAAGAVRLIETEIENLGDEWWPAGDAQPEIRVGYRWLDAAGEVLGEGPRTTLTETVAPGSTTRVMVVVETPASQGEYVMECALVHEDVRWFGEPIRAHIEVGDC